MRDPVAVGSLLGVFLFDVFQNALLIFRSPKPDGLGFFTSLFNVNLVIQDPVGKPKSADAVG